VVASSFQAEPSISLAVVNCHSYDDLCERYGVKEYPALRLFTGGFEIPFAGQRSARAVLGFINDCCGVEREIGGLLNAIAGRIPAAALIVVAFLRGDREGAIA
jgi:protein disulfide-isomerase A6